jgi:uncharacterized protein with von Willebrand factor type A (vWA) domain
VIAAVEGLIAELRKVGVPISVSENIDAVSALRVVSLGDREEVKTTLGSVLVKDHEHQAAYDAIFDIYFSGGRSLEDLLGEEPGTDGSRGPGDGSGAGALDSLEDAALRALLVNALDEGESALTRLIAQVLVDRHAGIQPGRAVAGTYYLFRTMRAVDPDRVLAQLAERHAAGGRTPDALGRRLLIEEDERRVVRFRAEVEAEIRRRLVADRGADAVAKTLRKPLPEDVDFLTASSQQVAEMRDIIGPMTRKLAARLAEKRLHRRRGTLDFRRTVRASMSTGGVPLTPLFKKPRPSKPELIVLADISGSVSTFAAFTLQLTYALRSEFSKVRSFVFVDGVDEVTDIFAESDSILEATRRINAEARGVWLDGRSDYGNALETFWERYGKQVRSRTSVLLLGDARTNYHSSGAAVVKRIAQVAGYIYWLNPEPAAAWDSGDSVMREYSPFCNGVFECRNVRQLRRFIEQLT